MKGIFTFEGFPVYLLAEEFYLAVLGSCLRNYKIVPEIRSQLQRASSSILLNLAEGAGKYSKKDKKNFYVITRGSIHECVAIIRIIRLEGKIEDTNYMILYTKLHQISQMMSGLITKMSQL
ncbi:MAG: four helix bundle protein [Candidatus Abawacabacteria bacterium]|nr:four helix bundle protein [Candidatus Abawacabacteria bacterium]